MTVAYNLAERITDRVVAQNHDALLWQFHTNTEDTAIYLDDGRAAVVPGSAREVAVEGWHRRVRLEITTAIEDILGLLKMAGAMTVMGASFFAMASLGDERILLTIMLMLVFLVASGYAFLSGMAVMTSLFGGSVARAVRAYRATERAGGSASTEYVRGALFRNFDVVDALAVDALTKEQRDEAYRE